MGIVGVRPGGREAPLATLAALMVSAAGGRGGVVVLEGEAGIGKTTVVRAAAATAVDAGLQLCEATCSREMREVALAPWAALLDRHVESIPVPRRDAAANATPAGAVSRSPGTPTARLAQFGALMGRIERAAAQRPALYVIDDLHWADAASIHVVDEVAQRVAMMALAVVVTVRPDELATPAWWTSATTIELTGLDRAAVATVVEQHGLGAEPGLVDLLMRRTKGNPFFLTELLRTIAAGSADSARVAANDVPRHVADLVRRRLAHLPSPAADLLGILAVVGHDGGLDLVAATADMPAEHVLEQVAIAEAAGVVMADGPSRWRFSHELVRDAVYGTLGPTTRARHHEQVLRNLTPDAASAARARHAVGALPLIERDEAVAYAIEAAEDASRRLAHEEAIGWYNHVGAVLGPHGGRRRVEALVGAAEATRATGDQARAQTLALEAASLAGGQPELFARAALAHVDPGADIGLACAEFNASTTRLLDRALAMQTGDDDATAVLLRSRLASQLYFSSEPHRARPLAEAAIAMARRLDDAPALFAALAMYHDGYVVGGDADAALAGSTELVALARRTGDPSDLLAARRARVLDLLTTGDLAGVDAEVAAFARVADELRLPAYLWWPALWRAMRALLDGRHGEAEALAGEAAAIGSGPFAGLALANLGFLLFFLRRDQGRLGELEEMTRAFARDHADIPAIATSLSLLLAEVGQLDEAAGRLAPLATDDRLHDRNWPSSWFMLARTAYLVGDRSAAESLLEAGRAFTGQCVQVSLATVCLGSADLGLAWLHDALGDVDEAERGYQRAEATNARLGARAWLAQARVDHARLVSGDPERARPLATLALAAADELGLTPVATAARLVLDDIGAPTKPRPVQAVGTFRRHGPTWELASSGSSVRLAHAKGLTDIAALLAQPGVALSAVELADRQRADRSTGTRGAEVFDTAARRQLRDRLAELEADIDEADADHDMARAEALRVTRDELVDAVAAGLGRRGRSRLLGDDGEKARKSVTARIRNSIEHIAAVDAALGRHLARSIDTGTWCVYRPEQPTDWNL